MSIVPDITEESLWRDFFMSDKGAEAQTIIVNYYLDFSKKISLSLAARYRSFGVSSNDCIQQGLLGLIDAIHKYTPEKSSFKTYSAYRIKGSILNFLSSYNEHLAIYNFNKRQKNIDFYKACTANVRANSLSDIFDVALLLSYDTIFEEMNDESSTDLSANEFFSDNLGFMLMDYVVYLDEKQAKVIHAYYFLDMNFREIAQELKMSASRVFELHALAIKNLRNLYHSQDNLDMVI